MGSFFNPVKIKLANIDVIEEVLSTISTPLKKIVLLHRGDDFLQSSAGITFKQQLANFEVKELAINLSNPDVEDLFHYYTEINYFETECIIGIGGGSILDLSKSLAALKNIEIDSVNTLRTIIKEKSYIENPTILPWIGIPTTSGTGSEVTCWATIWDRAHGEKLSIDCPALYANTAIIDSTLTATLPKELTASTALDALCHATEAYWSRSSNEISRVYALEAIKRIVNNFEKVAKQPTNFIVRNEMSLGSLYAGLAFSNTRTTACHSISYPLTLELGIIHGVAASMTLPKVMTLNFEEIIEKEKLLHAFGVKSCTEIQPLIEGFLHLSGFPSRLKDYNATEEAIEKVASNAFTKGRMDNNPVAFTKADVIEILNSIY